MGLISFTTLVQGATANASDVNTPLTTIYNEFNGNIADANVASGAAIAFSKISGGSSTALVAWASWTPTWTNVTIGNATVVGNYVQIGKTVHATLFVTVGSSTPITGAITFSLPVTAASRYAGSGTLNTHIGTAYLEDAGAQGYTGLIKAGSTTTAILRALGVGATWATDAAATATVPFTWGTGDFFACTITYEAA